MTYACRVCGRLSRTPRCPAHQLAPRHPGRPYNRTRHAVADRDQWTCMLCGDPIDPALKHPHPMALAIDHTVPRAVGGSDATSNLAACHSVCNQRKGANAA